MIRKTYLDKISIYPSFSTSSNILSAHIYFSEESGEKYLNINVIILTGDNYETSHRETIRG